MIDRKREEKMLLICRQIVKKHNEIKRFTAGFGKVEKCECPACRAAGELFGMWVKELFSEAVELLEQKLKDGGKNEPK